MLPHRTAAAAAGRAGSSLTAGYERRRRSLHPRALARITARLRASSLDRALIAGAEPAASSALAARATTLTSRRTRLLIAEGLEHALSAGQGPQRRWWAVSPRSPLLANDAAVRELAELLRGDAPLYAPGIAILNGLLTDGSGPAYRGRPQHAARLLDEARTAMVGPIQAPPRAVGASRASIGEDATTRADRCLQAAGRRPQNR